MKQIDIEQGILNAIADSISNGQLLNLSQVKEILPKKQHLYELKQQLKEYNYLIFKYYTFNLDQITYLIQFMIKQLENKIYNGHWIKYIDDEQSINWIYMLINEEDKIPNLIQGNNNFLDIYQNMDIIILIVSQINQVEEISLVPSNDTSILFKKLLDSHFNYINAIIDALINYRIDNELININKNDISKFLKQIDIEVFNSHKLIKK